MGLWIFNPSYGGVTFFFHKYSIFFIIEKDG
jgi:hypothetical protein